MANEQQPIEAAARIDETIWNLRQDASFRGMSNSELVTLLIADAAQYCRREQIDFDNIVEDALDQLEADPDSEPVGRTLQEHSEQNEKDKIADVLAQTNFNMARAAKQLGVSRVTLYNKLRKYKLKPKR